MNILKKYFFDLLFDIVVLRVVVLNVKIVFEHLKKIGLGKMQDFCMMAFALYFCALLSTSIFQKSTAYNIVTLKIFYSGSSWNFFIKF